MVFGEVVGVESDVFLVVVIENKRGWADEDLSGEPEWLLFAVNDTDAADKEACDKQRNDRDREDEAPFVLPDEDVPEAWDEPCGDEWDGGDMGEAFDGFGFVHERFRKGEVGYLISGNFLIKG